MKGGLKMANRLILLIVCVLLGPIMEKLNIKDKSVYCLVYFCLGASVALID